MVALQHTVVVDALHVDHLRLVMGTSMGGMHTWLWGETYPTMMDALMPLASLPVEIGGRNRVWRDTIVDLLQGDPGYDGGEYAQEPAASQPRSTCLGFSAARHSSTNGPSRRVTRPTRISTTRSSRVSESTMRSI